MGPEGEARGHGSCFYAPTATADGGEERVWYYRQPLAPSDGLNLRNSRLGRASRAVLIGEHMRQFKTYAVLVAMFAFVATAGGVMAGCGGGGQGFRADAGAALVITSTSLPTTLSGEAVDFPVELAGGCGGPYVIKVIEGHLRNILRHIFKV